MTTEQKEAIEIINKMIKSYIEADECGLSNNDFKHEIKAMQTLVNLVQDLQRKNFELNQKNEYFSWLNKDLKDEIKKLKKEMKK